MDSGISLGEGVLWVLIWFGVMLFYTLLDVSVCRAALLACTLICAAAIINGIKGKQLHIQHHIIRVTLSVVLTVGFAVL